MDIKLNKCEYTGAPFVTIGERDDFHMQLGQLPDGALQLASLFLLDGNGVTWVVSTIYEDSKSGTLRRGWSTCYTANNDADADELCERLGKLWRTTGFEEMLKALDMLDDALIDADMAMPLLTNFMIKCYENPKLNF